MDRERAQESESKRENKKVKDRGEKEKRKKERAPEKCQNLETPLIPVCQQMFHFSPPPPPSTRCDPEATLHTSYELHFIKP